MKTTIREKSGGTSSVPCRNRNRKSLAGCFAALALMFPCLPAAAAPADTAAAKLKSIAENFKDHGAASALAAAAAFEIGANAGNWFEPAFTAGESILRLCPAKRGNEAIRKEALQQQDVSLSYLPLTECPERSLATAYYQSEQNKVVAAVRSTVVPEGRLVIWKMYNMGFILKTSKHTVAFDLTNRICTFDESVVDDLDMLIISHAHGDHNYSKIATAMKAAGKPVIAPLAEIAGVTHVLYDAKKTITINGITVSASPQVQGTDPCNVTLLKMDGFTIAQTGDSNLTGSFDGRIDVLLHNANTVSGNVRKIMNQRNRGTAEEARVPQLIMMGHSQEIGHDKSLRRAFALPLCQFGRRKSD